MRENRLQKNGIVLRAGIELKGHLCCGNHCNLMTLGVRLTVLLDIVSSNIATQFYLTFF